MPTDFSFIDNPSFLSFLAKHENSDTLSLRLKDLSTLPFDKDLAITQIECRRKAKVKIPELYDRIAYPTNVSIEQASSEKLAKFHARIFKECDKVIDLTCGLGIDSYYISHYANSLTSIEVAPAVGDAARFNFSRLCRSNISVVTDTAEHFIEHGDYDASAIFVDPSRRPAKDRNKRIYSIKDTIPDISALIPRIRHRCEFMLVKASPMADITQTIKEFDGISHIWVLASKNECKELLFKIDFTGNHETAAIHTLNFISGNSEQHFSFAATDKSSVVSRNPSEGDMLYVPNSAIMKAGAFDIVAEKYGLESIASNSHLYLSERTIPEFPGKRYLVKAVYTFSKTGTRTLKSHVASATISCRNFPHSPEELRRKLKLSDGGDYHIFATTTAENKKILLLCEHAAENVNV